ncbi:CLUMA_CG013056, isoform A [Clunio marinus]|uniref:CLUMA_CG013056, isoform A n=1 Tax=Clunio marinus TaxID=568069 RepID=A0A1J1IJ27_9DIPT|nr:CLUMA_CG013056, isoform A [Clunio marinus]
MKILLFIIIFAVIICNISVSGSECPLCENGYSWDSTCTCSSERIRDNCGGLNKYCITCDVPNYCCCHPLTKDLVWGKYKLVFDKCNHERNKENEEKERKYKKNYN